MDPILLAGLGLAGMIVLMLLHVPIGIAMAIAGVVGYGVLTSFGAATPLLSNETASVIASADLAVIPLFLLMGSLASVSGLSADIYRLAYAFVGHRQGGLAYATIGGCAAFGAVCGSSVATAATFGRVALPEMLRRGYSPALATGSIAAGGTLGILVPPSNIMVIYAYITEQFVLTLFIAALIPSVIAVILDLAAIAIYVRINPGSGPPGPRMSWRERFEAARAGIGVLALLIAVIGGIYGGVFTVQEAAAVGAGFTFVFALLRGRLSVAVCRQIVSETAGATAMIYVILIGASVFSYFVSATKLPSALVADITGMGLPPILVIVVLIVMFVILGAIFDEVAAMLITMPFVFPLVIGLGYDPIWWGIVNVIVIEIGMICPPIGLNVFVLKGIARDIPLATIYRGIAPILAADLVRLAIIVVFPGLTLWLPAFLKG